MKLVAISFAALVVPFAIAAADRPGPPPRPPQEAIDACAKAKQGDTCSFTHRDHQIAGTCEAPPDGSTLACRPDHPPPPPPEAVAACASAKQGDTCSFTLGDRSLSGTCERGPDAAKPLACRPPRP